MEQPHPALPSEAPSAPVATSLWLIRHAEVEASFQGVFGGRVDMDLSPLGHEQARTLGRYLATRHFDAVYASPMKRVQQTLAPFMANSGPKPVNLSALREVDFGDWTGLKWADVQHKFGVSAFAWLDELDAGTIPRCETAKDLHQRVEPALRGILRDHPGQQVAIACHGGVIRMLLSILLEMPFRKMGCFEIEYTSISLVTCLGATARLELSNFTPWRDLPS